MDAKRDPKHLKIDPWAPRGGPGGAGDRLRLLSGCVLQASFFDEILSFADSKDIKSKSEENENNDELYNDALEIVKTERKASTSFLQRKLQIGYNRAARIIDQMEANGEVSKANHVGKREVLK